MFGGTENIGKDENGNIIFSRSDIKRYRQWYLSPDIDFTKIKTNKKGLRFLFTVFSAFKFPAPSLELSNGKLKLNALHFLPLSPALKTLKLPRTVVADLDALARCPKLQWLDLDGAPVRSITALQDLGELSHLSLADTRVTDLSPLHRLKQLRSDQPLGPPDRRRRDPRTPVQVPAGVDPSRCATARALSDDATSEG